MGVRNCVNFVVGNLVNSLCRLNGPDASVNTFSVILLSTVYTTLFVTFHCQINVRFFSLDDIREENVLLTLHARCLDRKGTLFTRHSCTGRYC